MNIKDIQQALQSAGFDPGPIDGIRGRKTILAIKAFQQANNLISDGLVGPKTRAVLLEGVETAPNPEFSIPTTIPWLETAFELIGTQEKRGSESNEAIIGWAEDLEITAYNDDDIPWCGLFVAHCVGSQMPEEPLPVNPLGARQWARFGHEVSPRLGAVMVFWRGSPSGWKGHVGLYWAEDDEAYHILGGNQSNAVTVTRISRKRLLTARWPHTGLAVDCITRRASTKGKLLSTNEA
ncbi:TIGR02594 family protein [Sansalvadorimonas sp. 2012CJ34-2]|uniref:TIGR02594 family protein n=1 Tax=Parendozoicomonas callyspongiae TaxID=2942213 RepID=A0ABT0PJX1_9GAMM|nr:TIGR02594 family protein [Sansalvadorimonas sp. 2012CJ34-2]MCL6271684.1 TIGR02594 family protein [Sansalvadorimonas sp. 2012CJ34-2]